jgi:ABC-type Na+ efflux pump permease subunit
MAFRFKDFQTYIYIVLMAIGLALFIISSNDLIFGNKALIDNGITFQSVGPWNYWIFTLGIIMTGLFVYLYAKTMSDVSKFRRLMESDSKYSFMKNMKDLEAIAQRLGTTYKERLAAAKEKWKIK